MPTPTLFESAFENRGLFSDHYLSERFPRRDDVQGLQDEADAAFEQVRDLYQGVAAEVDTWNEAQTEDNFVQPILSEVLGWSRVVQENIQRQGRRGRPDYALFVDEDRRETALQQAEATEATIFDHADAVADAKYWGRPLDGPAPDPAREKRAKMRRNNPSFQIIDYVTLTGVDWGILTNGTHWRLYYEGAPSRLETYFEVNLPEILRLAAGDEEDQEVARDAFRLFYALFRADAHRPTVDGEKFVDVVYEASDTYAETLEDTLKERVFDHVFLELATGLYENHARRNGSGDPEEVLDDVYRATLRLLYRLLFLLYAESRGLLPLDKPSYYNHSLTHLAERAREAVSGGRSLSKKHTDFWNDLDALFRTIDDGDPAFDVPAYNGGLFRRGSTENGFLDNHEIGQKYVAYALVNLTAVDPEGNPTGPSVDYTSLNVRQLGSIYEGLLEHRLVLDGGDLDLQTDEGERKETGSYYTPHYVVEYIVEETLGPIVDERIQQFEAAMDEINEIMDARDPDDPGVRAKLDQPRRKALDAFLTVRVCDPAMGSGHFLVYAADYLAERFGQILGRYPDHNPVTQRLEEIRQSILDELERQGVDTAGLADDNRLRDTSLLKRLVMKRCIYGVDLNPMAVELAKLSLWLHSFTVGAPLSFLDHHLKAGNSLVGTSVDAVVDEIQADLFGNVRDEILRGTKFLQDAAFNTDATLADVEQSAEAFRIYQDTMRPYKRLLDLWTAQHFGHAIGRTLVRDYAREVIDAYKNGEGAVLDEHADTAAAAEALSEEKRVFHWELEFPEVFYELDPPGDRDNPGFDAVIGNPPYVRIQTLSETDEKAVEFFNDAYEAPSGNYDIYALFAEKGGTLINEDGTLGYILPHKFFTANYGEGLRTWISDRNALRHVVHFESEQVFDHATTYTCLLFLEGSPRSEFSYLQPPSPEIISANGELETFTLQTDALDEKPWSFGDPKLLELRSRFEETHPSLEDVTSRIFQGLKTSADDVYIVEELAREDGTVHVYSPELDDEVWVEADLFHPLIKGGDVEAYHIADTDRLILFPYGPDENGEMDLLPADTLENQYPLTWEYLEENRDVLEGREDGRMEVPGWYGYVYPKALEVIDRPKIFTPDFADVASYAFDESGERYFTGGAAGGYGILVDPPHSPWYALALLNSRLLDRILKTVSSTFRGGWYSYESRFIKHLPIRQVEFTTPEDEREDHVAALLDSYKAARAENTATDANPVLEGISDHLDADRPDVVHDLLVHLAREITDLKAERATYLLDVTDYVPSPTDNGGVTLRDVGRYQPAPGVQDTLLADTTEERENLRVGRLEAERDGDIVHVRATARFKPQGDRDSWPDAVPDEAERDQWDYVETDPIPICTLHDCTEIEAGLIGHWLDALNAADSGFSSYRDNATKTNSLLDRIYDARFPDPSENSVQDALRPFLQNAQEAAKLDRQIAFTDRLIDRIVYRLYGLSDEEIAVVVQ
ncbi:BREX-1 system adenine-specific DNA-methyltransferase PglX [Salinibacter ruber]|uniref:BREX-1 system adenine-specific DNA-methyltransferase PglX n=1 Tax=Salinibacter ruber TaxID=146919 RepID=UPI00216A442A|nr:BREX-1 system adenine-specific DNA-methyltransferase PglX [Salinibacter ruber]MCS3697192.1 hypothetical protein [Salinibacter ruber]